MNKPFGFAEYSQGMVEVVWVTEMDRLGTHAWLTI